MRSVVCMLVAVALTGCVSDSPETEFAANSVSPGSGSTDGGVQLTIRGTGFEPGTTVTVGGTPAVVTSVTDTILTAIAPAGTPGAKDVVVTSPGGSSDTLGSSFTYIDAMGTMTGTGTMAPEPAACRVWVDDLTSARFAQGSATPLAHWRVFIGTDPANMSKIDAVVTATVQRINQDGTEDPEAEIITESERTNFDGVALIAYRPTSGFGDFRLTVVSIQHSDGTDACDYDAASNALSQKDQNIFI